MIVISDTSPINYLILTGDIGILPQLFQQVLIPQAVHRELQHAKTPQAVKDWFAHVPSWLTVEQADTRLFTPNKKLGDGEREAISLAIQRNVGAILIDDRDGSLEAQRMNLVTVGTVTVLERAAKQGLLDLPEALARLRQTSFRFPSAEIIGSLLRRDQARQPRE